MFKISLKSAQSLKQSVSSQTLFNLNAYEFFESRKNRSLVIAVWLTASIFIAILMQKYSDNRNSDNIIAGYFSSIAAPQMAIADELMALPNIGTSINTNKMQVSIPVKIPYQDDANNISSDSGKGNIKGYVKNEAGFPLPSADVLLFIGNHWVGATYTMENGEFNFNNIAIGCYKLKIIRDSFSEMAIPEFYLESNTVLRDIYLEKLVAAADNFSGSQKSYSLNPSAEIKKEPLKTGQRSLSLISSNVTGVTHSNAGLSGRGSRMETKVYCLDGAKVVGYSKSYKLSQYSSSTKFSSKHLVKRVRYKIWKLFNHRKQKKQKKLMKPLTPAYTEYNTEAYAPLMENEYMNPFNDPLSTFSIDVDNASYSNTRRMIQAGEMPPKDAVRIEEFINYFDYNYPQPKDEHPFSINLETASCPWNKDTRLVQIGLKGKEIERKDLSACNLVFLVDVSGSMQMENKLPLVQKSLKLLVDGLNARDKISLVTYAGAAGLALNATFCSKKNEIKMAIDKLNAGGSTAGGEGLMLAYKVAKENFIKDGNNRIILVTDGDFNVGVSSDGEMKEIVEKKRNEGIFLTVCGFGMGNYKDSKLETLADYGNGNYYYIDNFKESSKVFSDGLTGTLFTIAKDVKIQVEFNPAFVKAYRLIGYENRLMEAQDFANDAKDAGELGAGHTVTALYEIIPAGSNAEVPGFIPLKYQENKSGLKDFGAEMLTVKLRYKKPDENISRLIVQTLNTNTKNYNEAGESYRYVCAVTMYAMLLRDSKFKGGANYELSKSLLEGSSLNVGNGYKKELMELIDKMKVLSIPK